MSANAKQLALVPDLPKAKRLYTPEQKARKAKRARMPEQMAKHAAAVRARYAILPRQLTPQQRAKKRAHERARYAAPEQRQAVRERGLLRKYGVSRDAFDVLFQTQGGRCAICRVPLAHGHGTHLDHDHATSRVRGLLCLRCNRGLGMLADDPERLLAAVAYLRKGNV